jgi:2-alkenal reductase
MPRSAVPAAPWRVLLPTALALLLAFSMLLVLALLPVPGAAQPRDSGAAAARAAGPAASAPRAVVPRGPLPEAERRVVELFETAAPSVAYITSEVVQTDGFFRAELARSAGSGFVWTRQGTW